MIFQLLRKVVLLVSALLLLAGLFLYFSKENISFERSSSSFLSSRVINPPLFPQPVKKAEGAFLFSPPVFRQQNNNTDNDSDNDDENDELFEKSLRETKNDASSETPLPIPDVDPKIDTSARLPKIYLKEPLIQQPLAEPQGIAIAIGGGSFMHYKKGDIVFSEIAWMGSNENANYEWIELYNPTNEEISLQGFTIEKNDGTLLIGEKGDEFTISHTIPPYGYILLERNEAAVNINADKLYDGSLANSGETLILKDGNGDEIDRVEMKQGWQAGKNETQEEGYKPTMSFIQGIWRDGIPTPKTENKEYKIRTCFAEPCFSLRSKKEMAPQFQSYPPQSVVISEITWMGDEQSSNNEWMEIYSNSTSTINLSGWTLEAKDGSPIIALSGLIAPREYFLLERTDDNPVPEITANVIYEGALENEGEVLLLKDPRGNEIDKVGEDGKIWYAGDNAGKKTMQKNNLAFAGTQNSNWFTAPSTPKSENKKEEEPQPLPASEPHLADYTPSLKFINYQFHDVLINEIAWMGTLASSQDEWLELKNTTSTAITLENWKLEFSSNASSTANFTITFEAGDIIPPNGFFILERNATSTIQNKRIFNKKLNSKVYSGSASQMANSGEYIVLRDGNGIVIDVVDGTNNWEMGTNSTKGDNAKKQSMERSLSNVGMWYTFSKGYAQEGGETIIDRGGNPIIGTPNCENSQEQGTCAVD